MNKVIPHLYRIEADIGSINHATMIVPGATLLEACDIFADAITEQKLDYQLHSIVEIV